MKLAIDTRPEGMGTPRVARAGRNTWKSHKSPARIRGEDEGSRRHGICKGVPRVEWIPRK